MTTPTPTDATPGDKDAATQLHQEGLRRALAILSTQEPTAAYYALLQLEEAGQLDAQLTKHARALTKLDACTTAHLEMSHADLETLLRCMTYAFEEMFGSTFVHDAIDDETSLGRLGDFAHALAVVADQAAGAACWFTGPPKPRTPVAAPPATT